MHKNNKQIASKMRIFKTKSDTNLQIFAKIHLNFSIFGPGNNTFTVKIINIILSKMYKKSHYMSQKPPLTLDFIILKYYNII